MAIERGREELKDMVDLAIARYHAENVVRLTNIEARIIGIDGNGTGKPGALQRLESKVDALTDNVQSIISTDTNDKAVKRVRAKDSRILLSLGVALLGIVGTLLGKWIEHLAGW